MASCKKKRNNSKKLAVKQLESFVKMLYNDAVKNDYEGTGYLGNEGTIVNVTLMQNNVVDIVIDSFDKPPKRSVLKLKLFMYGVL